MNSSPQESILSSGSQTSRRRIGDPMALEFALFNRSATRPSFPKMGIQLLIITISGSALPAADAVALMSVSRDGTSYQLSSAHLRSREQYGRYEMRIPWLRSASAADRLRHRACCASYKFQPPSCLLPGRPSVGRGV
jgi:hypothetical protein